MLRVGASRKLEAVFAFLSLAPILRGSLCGALASPAQPPTPGLATQSMATACCLIFFSARYAPRARSDEMGRRGGGAQAFEKSRRRHRYFTRPSRSTPRPPTHTARIPLLSEVELHTHSAIDRSGCAHVPSRPPARRPPARSLIDASRPPFDVTDTNHLPPSPDPHACPHRTPGAAQPIHPLYPAGRRSID